MVQKPGGGGIPQKFDKNNGRYIGAGGDTSKSDYDAMSAAELKKQQAIELEAKKDIPKASGFNRLDTEHHKRHAKEMGYNNQKEYEQAAAEFWNKKQGTVFYSHKRDRFYMYDEKSKKFISVSKDGVIHTFMVVAKKAFEKKEKQDGCVEY